MKRTLLGVLALGAVLGSCSDSSKSDRPQLGFVTNCVAEFWVIAEHGVRAAEKEFDVDVDVRMPDSTVEAQKRYLQDLLSRGVDGIAVSVIDGDNQVEQLDELCEQVPLITHDSDAPESNRLCYVGMDNYKAGRDCGKLVKEALPDGGSIMMFVGMLEQDNAKGRRQGVIDELLDRPYNPKNYDPPGEIIGGDKYTIVDTRTDRSDFSRAKSNAEAAVAAYPDLACMVGLFEYNPPACLAALEEADKLGQIKVVAFDENVATLQGILDGTVHGTVVQQPYKYGYESVRILAALARGDKSVLPESGFFDVPHQVIRKDNARQYWDELNRLTGKDGATP